MKKSLKNLQNSGKTPMSEFSFNKVEAYNFIKKKKTPMFFCEFCETFKNTIFKELPRATASGNLLTGETCISTDKILKLKVN